MFQSYTVEDYPGKSFLDSISYVLVIVTNLFNGIRDEFAKFNKESSEIVVS